MPAPELVCAAALSAWLLLAAWIDLRTRRIPNWLVASGMLAGLLLQAIAPAGAGLFAYLWGGMGALQALLGLGAGLALFMPLYLLRAFGAGDVKLLAMVGVWMGPKLLFSTALLILLTGGVLALIVMLASRSSRQVLANVRFMLTTTLIGAQTGKLAALEAPVAGTARLPYAMAITVGTLAQIGWMLAQSHFS